MRIFKKISLMLITIIIISCSEEKKRVPIESEKIDNFSNINYQEADDYPYFNEIKNLPYGFSLGDYSDYGSILFLTESANVYPFDDESLQHFLTTDELEFALETYIDSSYTEPITRKIKYYPYGSIITKSYVLLVINKRKSQSKGRKYEFDVRTFTFDGQLIDNITIAKWDDENEKYFGGWIMPEMQIKLEFESGEVEYFIIQEDGKIIKKDANKS